MNRGADARTIARLAVPALGTLAADPVVTLIDTAFVGRLGPEALGALGVDAAIFSLAFIAFNFLQYGVTPMTGNLVGAGRADEAAGVVRHALVIALGLGLVVASLLAVFAEPLVRLMAAPPETVEGAVAYLRIRAWAAPAVMVVMAGNGAFRGHQDTVTPLRLTLLLNAVNLVLDPLLIFGLDWGLEGAAVATVVAQVVGAIAFLVAMTRRGHVGRGPVTSAGLRPFVKVGWELAVRTGSLVLTITVAARVAASIGTKAIAAHQVAMQVWFFLTLSTDSLAIAAQSLVSLHLGKDDEPGAEATARTLLRWGAVVGVALTALVLAVRPWLGGWFSTDGEVIGTIGDLLVWVAAIQLPGALLFVYDGVYLGASRFRLQAIVTASASTVAIALLVTGGRLGWGVDGVWLGITAMVLGRLVALAWLQAGGRMLSPRVP